MTRSRMSFAALAAIGVTLGAALNARALENEAVVYDDQCYRTAAEAPGTCSVCKDESCRSGTYCCKISTPSSTIGSEP